mmetsp:Transcript_2966/g.7755  ORF Transcript_2966/g.7755 Transcript_2966/m.7755 type:complete len:223 (-) Transcript_2966:27-695(-)
MSSERTTSKGLRRNWYAPLARQNAIQSVSKKDEFATQSASKHGSLALVGENNTFSSLHFTYSTPLLGITSDAERPPSAALLPSTASAACCPTSARFTAAIFSVRVGFPGAIAPHRTNSASSSSARISPSFFSISSSADPTTASTSAPAAPTPSVTYHSSTFPAATSCPAHRLKTPATLFLPPSPPNASPTSSTPAPSFSATSPITPLNTLPTRPGMTTPHRK